MGQQHRRLQKRTEDHDTPKGRGGGGGRGNGARQAGLKHSGKLGPGGGAGSTQGQDDGQDGWLSGVLGPLVEGIGLGPGYRSKDGSRSPANGIRAEVQAWRQGVEREVAEIYKAKTPKGAGDEQTRAAMAKSRDNLLDKVRADQMQVFYQLLDWETGERDPKNLGFIENGVRTLKKEMRTRLQMFRETRDGEVREDVVQLRDNDRATRGVVAGPVDRIVAEAALDEVLAQFPGIFNIHQDNVTWVEGMQKIDQENASSLIAKTVELVSDTAGPERWVPVLRSMDSARAQIERSERVLMSLRKTWKSETREQVPGSDMNIAANTLAAAWWYQRTAVELAYKTYTQRDQDRREKESVAAGFVTTFKTVEGISDALLLAMGAPGAGTFTRKAFAKLALLYVGYRVAKRVVGEGTAEAVGWTETQSLGGWFKMVKDEGASASVDVLLAGVNTKVMPFFKKLAGLPLDGQIKGMMAVAKDYGIDFVGDSVGGFVGDVTKAAVAGDDIKVLELLKKNIKNASIGVVAKGVSSKAKSKLSNQNAALREAIPRKTSELAVRKELSERLDIAMARGDVSELNAMFKEYRSVGPGMADTLDELQRGLVRGEDKEKLLDVLIESLKKTSEAKTDAMLGFE